MTRTHAGLLTMCLFVVSCAAAAPNVDMSGRWPEKARPYADTHQQWTRHQSLRHGVDAVLEAHATLKSAPWRAAFVAQKSKRARLTEDESATLRSEQRADNDKAWEIVLVVATHNHRYNDLHKQERSIWKVRLLGSEGRWVPPESIRQDKRPAGLLRYWFPDARPFFKTYVLLFPKQTADGKLLAPPGQGLALRIGSALGNVELRWSPK